MALAVTDRSISGATAGATDLRRTGAESIQRKGTINGFKDLTSADLEREIKQIRTNTVVPFNGSGQSPARGSQASRGAVGTDGYDKTRN